MPAHGRMFKLVHSCRIISIVRSANQSVGTRYGLARPRRVQIGQPPLSMMALEEPAQIRESAKGRTHRWLPAINDNILFLQRDPPCEINLFRPWPSECQFRGVAQAVG